MASEETELNVFGELLKGAYTTQRNRTLTIANKFLKGATLGYYPDLQEEYRLKDPGYTDKALQLGAEAGGGFLPSTKIYGVLKQLARPGFAEAGTGLAEGLGYKAEDIKERLRNAAIGSVGGALPPAVASGAKRVGGGRAWNRINELLPSHGDRLPVNQAQRRISLKEYVDHIPNFYPELNDRATREGVLPNLKIGLDIIEDSGRSPELTGFVKHLKKIMRPEDLDVPIKLGPGAYYDPTKNQMQLRFNSPNAILHEAVHAGTSRKLPFLVEGHTIGIGGTEYWENLTKAANSTKIDPDVRDLTKLFQHTFEGFYGKNIFDPLRGDILLGANFGNPQAFLDNGGLYGFGDLHEFLSEGLTNPEFQRILRNTKGIGKNKNAWTEFIGIIKRLIGYDDIDDTALDELLRLGDKMIQKPLPQKLDLIKGSDIAERHSSDQIKRHMLAKLEKMANPDPTMIGPAARRERRIHYTMEEHKRLEKLGLSFAEEAKARQQTKTLPNKSPTDTKEFTRQMSNYRSTADSVLQRTTYGIRKETPNIASHRAYWSNAQGEWLLNRNPQAKPRVGQELKLDANEILIPARSAKEARVIMESLPPLPLYAGSFEKGGILKSMTARLGPGDPMVKQLREKFGDEAVDLPIGDLDKYVLEFMDKIRGK